ncbi:MAG: hypothetical protein ACPG5B_10025 [Chitinophagales bacterium]
MKEVTHNELETVIDIKKQIVKAMSNSEILHFWHIESQKLVSFSDTHEAADEYNDQIEASPEEYLQILSDKTMSEQALAEQFIAENLQSDISGLGDKTAEEIFAEVPNWAAAWTTYRKQFYGNLAENWLSENGFAR